MADATIIAIMNTTLAHTRAPQHPWRERASALWARLARSRFVEARQRRWIFRPTTDRAPAGTDIAGDLSEHWIPVDESESQHRDVAARLHALWLAQPADDAPVLLVLHGARCNLRHGLARMRRLHELGFAVLGIDYRGFGRSSAALPSEQSTCADAAAAWRWLTHQYPNAPCYAYGHSLGGAVAVQLASQVEDMHGLILEGTFTSIPDVVATFRWGWLPLAPLITQRFDSARHMAQLRVPVLVVHGSEDRLVRPHLGRALYERVAAPKRFVLVEGASHHDTYEVGHAQYREAVQALFGLPL